MLVFQPAIFYLEGKYYTNCAIIDIQGKREV